MKRDFVIIKRCRLFYLKNDRKWSKTEQYQMLNFIKHFDSLPSFNESIPSERIVILRNLLMILLMSIVSYLSEYIYRKYCHSFTVIGYFTSIFFASSDTCQSIRNVTISCTYMIRHTIPLLAYNIYSLLHTEMFKKNILKNNSKPILMIND